MRTQKAKQINSYYECCHEFCSDIVFKEKKIWSMSVLEWKVFEEREIK